MRDRLIEMLNDKTAPWNYLLCPANIRSLTDYLLKNGVIVPPCKVGDKVYKIWCGEILEYEVLEYRYDGCVTWFWSYNDKYKDYRQKLIFESAEIGKTVFLTREEAEKALQEVKGK